MRISAAFACLLLGPVVARASDYPIRPAPFTAVHVQSEFWSPRLETNRQTTVWYTFNRCEETGRIDNFAKAGGLMPGEFRGIPFDDSDVFKVIEGAAYSLAIQPDPKLDTYLDELIVKIAAAQEPDGYLYTARRLFPEERMPEMSGRTRWSNLINSHELYNVGHLYEAAVAHFQATGKRTLLEVALKNADLLCETFGPGRIQEPPGHQEIEMGLVKLYRATGRQKYLDLARYFIELRGRADTHRLRGAYQQDHKPIHEQDEAVGHSVRAIYFYSGVADVAALTGDAKLTAAIDRLWENVVGKKLHLTGGIGAEHSIEGFGPAYALPNDAYNETCAAIANALWNHRMFLLHGDARYLDVLERILYNGFLSGVSLTGDLFFYPNPLVSHGNYQRSPWFGCACCPVNVVRFLPQIAGYVYAARDNAAYVNLFVGGSGEIELASTPVRLTQETRYPWDGDIRITVEPEKRASFALKIRIPGWALNQPVPGDLYRHLDPPASREAIRLRVNGRPADLAMADGFAVVERRWRKGDVVELTLPMPVRRVVAHDAVKANEGLVAIERGPLVYCAEEADNGKHLFSLVLDDELAFTPEHRPDLLGGVTVLRAPAMTLIPYYAWCHRGAGKMNVWMARTPDKAAPVPRITVASESRVTASHIWHADHLDALNDQIEPKGSGDHAIARFTWWDHRGSAEWVQYDFAKPAKVSTAGVYWFDDTGRGACRVPASWKLLYKSGDEWKPVEATGALGVEKDQYNTVAFTPVETDALRLEVQLQPEWSGGILEWKVE